METSIKLEELFEGALIRHGDKDMGMAVITKLQGGQVDLADAFDWHETRIQSPDDIYPALLADGLALGRMGFLRDVSSINPQFNLDTPIGLLTVFQQGESWILTNGNSSAPVIHAHQVQAESQRLFEFVITVARPGVEAPEAEDYYLE